MRKFNKSTGPTLFGGTFDHSVVLSGDLSSNEILRASVDFSFPDLSVSGATGKPIAGVPNGVSPLPASSTPTLLISDTADHIINSTESDSVAFTVSGLQGNETGAVTFTDAANHQVVVNVGGNGSF